jgi:hypothetical protein
MVFSRIELFIGIGGRERLGCAATLRGQSRGAAQSLTPSNTDKQLDAGEHHGSSTPQRSGAVRLLESSSNGFYFLFPGLNSTSR